MLEERIVRFCAPTLAGIKTGGLFNACGIDNTTLRHEAESIRKEISSRGLDLRLFPKKGRHTLVYVYRESALAHDLNQADCARFLANYRYDVSSNECALRRLGERIIECEHFPHEVGVFLSYPLSDVISFIENGSKTCKACGHWCVYSDEEKAHWCFNRFDRCTTCYKNLYNRGHRIGDLAVAR